MLYTVSDSDMDGSVPSPAAPLHVSSLVSLPQGILLLFLNKVEVLLRAEAAPDASGELNFTAEHKGPRGWQVPPGFSGSTFGHLKVIVLHAASKSSCGSCHKP